MDAECQELRQEVLSILSYILRKNEDAQKKLAAIRVGSDRDDLTQDLYDLYTLGMEHLDELTAINMDATKLELAKAKAEELVKLVGLENADSIFTSENKVKRDRLYWLMANYCYELRDTGKFVFRNDTVRRASYVFRA